MNGRLNTVETHGAEIRAKFNPLWIVQAGILFICFLLVFGPTMPPLIRDWLSFDTFSHGLLVPFISAYMVWRKRDALVASKVCFSAWGLSLIVPAVLLGILGKAIGDAFTERVGLVLCFSGLIWLVFGSEVFKRLIFPLGYLFLMIPFPYLVVKEVAYQLRILNAVMAAPALRVLGVPVFRDAYYLHLPDVTLEVADLCSGISSVFALLALGAAYAYFIPLRPAWKALVILSTFPFATLINLLRIILTAALAYYIGPVVLGVLIHQATGTVTFFIALFLFIALSEFLQRHWPRRSARSAAREERVSNDATGSIAANSKVAGKSWLPVILAMAVLMPAVMLTFGMKSQGGTPLAAGLQTVPLSLAGFQANENKTNDAYRDPNAEKDLSRRYTDSSGRWVELYIGFGSNQVGEKRLRSPKLQFPYGWNFVWIEPIRLQSSAGEIDANWMLTQSNQVQVLVLYWYQSRDKTFSGETANRLNQIRGAILDRRTDGAIVRLAMPVADKDQIDQTKKALTEFAASLYPELRRILPR